MEVLSLKGFKELKLVELPVVMGIQAFLIQTPKENSSLIKNELIQKIANLENKYSGEIQIRLGENGKPHLTGTNYQFNLSHSDEYIALAVSPAQELGIDIESWRSREKLEPISLRYFHQLENEALKEIKDDFEWESLALRIWTHKEAKVKLIGGTLFQGLSKVNTLADVGPRHHHEVRGSYSLTLMRS